MEQVLGSSPAHLGRKRPAEPVETGGLGQPDGGGQGPPALSSAARYIWMRFISGY